MPTKFFRTQKDWRGWLSKNHAAVKELFVGFYKKGAGLPSITYPEALDEALCFGWIDGLKRSIDGQRYCIRFTPRKANSTWSHVNLTRAAELEKAGLIHKAGLVAYKGRDPTKTGPHSSPNKPRKFSPALERKFRAAKSAWTYFQAQPPGYKRTGVFWIMSAKKPEIRERCLAQLMSMSAAEKRLPMLSGKSENSGKRK